MHDWEDLRVPSLKSQTNSFVCVFCRWAKAEFPLKTKQALINDTSVADNKSMGNTKQIYTNLVNAKSEMFKVETLHWRGTIFSFNS